MKFQLNLLTFALATACTTPQQGAPTSDSSVSTLVQDGFRNEAVRAEDARNAAEFADDILSSNDKYKRVLAARALARIADDRSVTILLKGLHAAEPEVLRWAAYGLGYACKGREDKVAPALEARIAAYVKPVTSPPPPQSSTAAASLPESAAADVEVTLLRALGHCVTPTTETKLRTLMADSTWHGAAALALGDLALRQKDLAAETQLALADRLDAAVPTDEALYPLSRVTTSEASRDRVAAAFEKALAHPSPYRLYAIRGIAKLPKTPPRILAEIVASNGFLPAERIEAAKGLALLGEAGHREAAALVPKLLPANDAFALTTLVGSTYALIATLVSALESDVPKASEPVLYGIAQLKPPGAPPPVLTRRIAALRCQAAQALAKGDYESPVLAECDARGSEIWERARLGALVRRPLTGARLNEWRTLLGSTHVRVREAALSAIESHAELKEDARIEIAKALTAKPVGVVATAAEIVFRHPERMHVVSAKARRAALDPKAPPPGAVPETDVDPRIAEALAEAMKRQDVPPGMALEMRTSVLDAAAVLRLPAAREHAKRLACDGNASLRTHAQAALSAFGEAFPRCVQSASVDVPPMLDKPAELVFQTDAGQVSIALDPTLAPVTTAHLATLARAGFYKGITVHRVVPGFVVQFGDPGGDGYGGSDKTLRCETSPIPFEALDVGMALSGRDTGSSQMFVTLSRTPHLDGDYAWVGRAKGDWTALMEGDTLLDVTVKD